METLFSVINKAWPVVSPLLLAGLAVFLVRELWGLFSGADEEYDEWVEGWRRIAARLKDKG